MRLEIGFDLCGKTEQVSTAGEETTIHLILCTADGQHVLEIHT